LITHAPYTALTLGAASLAVTIPAAVVVARRRLTAREWATVGLSVPVFAAAASAVSAVNLARMSTDSHQFLMLANVVGSSRTLDPHMVELFGAWSAFQVVSRSLATFTQVDYLYALQPMLAVSFLAVFACSLRAGTRALGATGRGAWLAVGLVTASLFTIYFVVYHAVYIHTNLFVAVYLFGFVVLFWLAEITRDASGLPASFLCLVAMAIQRLETPGFALVLLALTLLPSKLPRHAILPCLVAWTVVVAGWFELLARRLPTEGAFLTPARCRIVELALAIFLLVWLAAGERPLRRVVSAVPSMVAAAFALVVASAFALRPSHMFESARAWSTALTTLPQWGVTWPLVAALLLFACALKPPPFRSVFTVTIPCYFGYVLLLALGRPVYGSHLGDSANRMALHILPLAFFYLGTKLVPALQDPGANAPSRAHDPIDSPVIG
jgi:hypothetical protein